MEKRVNISQTFVVDKSIDPKLVVDKPAEKKPVEKEKKRTPGETIVEAMRTKTPLTILYSSGESGTGKKKIITREVDPLEIKRHGNHIVLWATCVPHAGRRMGTHSFILSGIKQATMKPGAKWVSLFKPKI